MFYSEFWSKKGGVLKPYVFSVNLNHHVIIIYKTPILVDLPKKGACALSRRPFFKKVWFGVVVDVGDVGAAVHVLEDDDDDDEDEDDSVDLGQGNVVMMMPKSAMS